MNELEAEYVPPSKANFIDDIIYDNPDEVTHPQSISQLAKKLERSLNLPVEDSYAKMDPAQRHPLHLVSPKTSKNDTNQNNKIEISPINLKKPINDPKKDQSPLQNETIPRTIKTPPPLPGRKHNNAPKCPGIYTHKQIPDLPKAEDFAPIMPMNIIEMKEYKGKAFKLKKFADTFLGQLPIVVNVCRGYYGQSELYTLSEDEKFALCFLSDYKTMIGMESNGVSIEIPITDYYSMTLLSERKEYDKKTRESIQDIMNLNPTPKRVMAVDNFKVGNIEVKKGDILSTFTIKYNRDSGNPETIVFKDNDEKDIALAANSPEKFSLTLSFENESFETAIPKCKFPQRAYVQPKNRPTGLASKYNHESNTLYIISEIKIGKIFIAHVYEDKITTKKNSRQGTVLEIPLDMDIEVEVLGKLEEKTYQTKEELFTAYQHVPKRKIIRKDDEYQPISKVLPNKSQNNSYLPQSCSLPRQCSLDTVVPILPSKAPLGDTNIYGSNVQTDKLLVNEKQRNTDLNRMAQKLDGVVKKLESELTTLRDQVGKKDKVIKELLTSRGLPPVPGQVGNPISSSGFQDSNYSNNYDYTTIPTLESESMEQHQAGHNSISSLPEESVLLSQKDLINMNVDDVSRLLEALNMSKYIEKFEAEAINGEMLEEMDDHILQEDLSIESGLHRKKLLKVIDKLKKKQDISNYMTLDMLKKQINVSATPNTPITSRPMNTTNTSDEKDKDDQIYIRL